MLGSRNNNDKTAKFKMQSMFKFPKAQVPNTGGIEFFELDLSKHSEELWKILAKCVLVRKSFEPFLQLFLPIKQVGI